MSTPVCFIFPPHAYGWKADKIAVTLLGHFGCHHTSKEEKIDTIADKGDMKHYPQYPAIKLARFGRDKKYEKQGVGKNVIIPWVVGYMKSLEHVAIRFITVDAYPNRVKYYEDLGFVPNQHEDYKRKENEQPTSMRLDLKMPCLKDVNSV